MILCSLLFKKIIIIVSFFSLKGYGGYGRDPYARGGDPYARGGDPMYDRRQPYPPPGGRAMGGSGPMRGPDPYAG